MFATEHPFLENPFLGPNFEAEDNTLASECIIAYAKQEKISSYQATGRTAFEDGLRQERPGGVLSDSPSVRTSSLATLLLKNLCGHRCGAE